MALSEFLERASLTPFDWGGHDCCQMLRRWVWQKTGADPAPHFRYSSEREAALLACRAGGLVALIGDLATAAGLARIDEPQAEDIGIIRTLTAAHGIQPVGAIFTGFGWSFITPSGLSRAKVEHVAAWGFNHG